MRVPTMMEFGVTIGQGILAVVFSAFLLRSCSQPDGPRRDIRDITDTIQAGTRAFSQIHFRALFAFLLLAALALVLAFAFLLPHSANPTPIETACWVAGSFVLGALSVQATMNMGMWSTKLCIRRLMSAERAPVHQLLIVGLRTMASSGLLCVAVPIMAAGALSAGAWVRVGGDSPSHVVLTARLPILLVSFAFGSCLSSLVARALTSVFESSVSLVGQRHLTEPKRTTDATELSRLVARGIHHAMEACADIPASLSSVAIAAIVSGVSLCASSLQPADQVGFVMFGPLLSSFGLFASAVGIVVVRGDQGESPARAIDRGMASMVILAVGGQLACARWVLGASWLPFFGASVAGLAGAIGGIVACRWHTSAGQRRIIQQAKGSLAGVLLAGIAHGAQRASILLASLGIPIALGYVAGARSGLDGGATFGVAVATTTLLMPAAYITAVRGMAEAASVGVGIEEESRGADASELRNRLESLARAGGMAGPGFSSIGAAGGIVSVLVAFVGIGQRLRGMSPAWPSSLGVWSIGAMLAAAIVLSWFLAKHLDAVLGTTQLAARRLLPLTSDLDHEERGVELEQASRASDRQWYLVALMHGSLRQTVPVILVGLTTALVLDVGCWFIGSHIDRSQAPILVGGLLVNTAVIGLVFSLGVEGTASALNSIWKLWKTDSSKSKSTVDDRAEWENNRACGAAVMSETVGGTLLTMAAPALQSLLKVLATVSLVLAPLFF